MLKKDYGAKAGKLFEESPLRDRLDSKLTPQSPYPF
jgi:hypothetical protein